ncbi:glycosyltransferase family 4 protein [uncultured Pontibacter sp.]|uniref:glycosyltransferase family 4 protein n=1 Tax=uncultured Pontibacter sp. TaxID=453356 RepID=UPI00260CF70D|nr:glycosyltransferase family 4 protein [uncultured Pontibacter sp.]
MTTIPISLKKLLEGQLRFMVTHGYEVSAVSSPGRILNEVCINEGVSIKGIRMTRKITPIADLVALIMLIVYLKKEKPQIVHSHTPKAGLIGMLAAWLCGIPYRLHTVAGLPLLEAKGVKRKLLEFTEWITYACATMVYPNSHNMKSIINESNLCKPNKLKVIGNGSSNGIDTSFFDPALFDSTFKTALKAEIGIKDREKVLCFIGRVVVDKGITELISSFIETVSQYPDTKLILVGPFEEELDPLDEQTKKTILSHPNIKFLDYQDDVRPYLAISDLFVFPSYREGFPNVVMQAGAMGVPSIVSNINGCNEIVEQGENGLIVPLKDSKALSEAITYLLDNEKVLDEMSSKCRKMIVDRYDQQYVWGELLKEYQSLCSNRKKQRLSYVS